MDRYESETQYIFNDAEKTLEACTFNKRMKEKFLKLADERPNEVTLEHKPLGEDDEVRIMFPKSWLKIKPPRVFTEEERELMRARGKALYEAHLAKHDEADSPDTDNDDDIDASEEDADEEEPSEKAENAD